MKIIKVLPFIVLASMMVAGFTQTSDLENNSTSIEKLILVDELSSELNEYDENAGFNRSEIYLNSSKKISFLNELAEFLKSKNISSEVQDISDLVKMLENLIDTAIYEKNSTDIESQWAAILNGTTSLVSNLESMNLESEDTLDILVDDLADITDAISFAVSGDDDRDYNDSDDNDNGRTGNFRVGNVGNRTGNRRVGNVGNRTGNKRVGNVGNRTGNKRVGNVGNRTGNKRVGNVGNRTGNKRVGNVGNRTGNKRVGNVGNRTGNKRVGNVGNRTGNKRVGNVGNRTGNKRVGNVGNRTGNRRVGNVGNRTRENQNRRTSGFKKIVNVRGDRGQRRGNQGQQRKRVGNFTSGQISPVNSDTLIINNLPAPFVEVK